MDSHSFGIYYDNIIEPVLAEYISSTPGLVLNPFSKNRIWSEYCFFNQLCKTRYMKEEAHLIDRHKVVACYIYAVEKAHVVTSVVSLQEGDDTHLLLNERLALCFGMSVFRALIMDLADGLEDLEMRGKAMAAFGDGFAFPECNHGNYIDNIRSQLYFTYRDGNYNILALAETLYFIEIFNLQKSSLPANLFSYSSK